MTWVSTHPPLLPFLNPPRCVPLVYRRFASVCRVGAEYTRVGHVPGCGVPTYGRIVSIVQAQRIYARRDVPSLC